MERRALSLIFVSFGPFQAAPAFACHVDLRIIAPKRSVHLYQWQR